MDQGKKYGVGMSGVYSGFTQTEPLQREVKKELYCKKTHFPNADPDIWKGKSETKSLHLGWEFFLPNAVLSQ